MTVPTIGGIRANLARLAGFIGTTPVRRAGDEARGRAVGDRTEV
jgi:hypothetical protein